MSDYAITDRSRVRRLPDRARYDADTVHAIIDAGMVSHVGFVAGGEPVVIPMLHARDGNTLLLHGASSSRILRHVAGGHAVSICITHLDGIVLAKTAFNQSVNYRSVVIFGQGSLIEDPVAKLAALERLTNRLVPGQWGHVRAPDAQELKATSIVAVAISEATAKVRSGPPGDDGADRDHPAWAGVIPIEQVFLPPVAAGYTEPGMALPAHIADWLSSRRRS